MWLFCLLLAYLIVRGAEDCTSMVTGRESPRHKERMRRLDDRARAGSKPAPQSSAGRYFSGLVTDAWDSAHHRRDLDRERRDERRRRRAQRRKERGAAREDARDEKHRRRTTEPTDTETPDPGEATTEAWPTTDAGPGQPTGEEPSPATTDQEADPSEVTSNNPTDHDESEPDQPDSEHDDSAPAEQPVMGGMELPTMSTPTGEISGLNSAIGYAENLSTWCAHTGDQISSVMPSDNDAATSCEQARASLEDGGVTGQPLSDVTQVQEQMTAAVQALNDAIAQLEAAGAAADSLKARLSEHLSVQEAYAANPEAGHREFVTAD